MSSAPEVVFAGTDGGAITDLAAYEAVGGLTALRRAREMTPEQIIAELDASSLRGRGGAFFPTGRKWSFVPKPDQNPRPHYLVVNADESEPGTFKDREIMLRVPFRFLEGCLIAARGIESQHVFVYIRGEYEHEWEILVSALEQLREAKLLGGVTIVLHRGAGAYICGEETALLESLEGRRGQPRTKPPFPAIAGLYASPTAVNNVESITTVTPIIEMGGAEYAKLGVEDSTGTRVFSLSGNVVRPGNYELPHGYPLHDLIHEVGGGIADGRTLKAVIPGGSSTPILTASEAEKVTLDFDSLSQAGSAIGSAAVIVLDDRCCMVQLGVRVSQFYEHESCGKCTPCRVGHPLADPHPPEDRVGSRHARRPRPAARSSATGSTATCLCPLGDSDAIAVASYVAKFREEFLQHIEEGRLPLPRRLVARRHRRADRRARGPRRPARDPPPARGGRMSDGVKVTIDDREIEVAKGTGLVETAEAAGIEIPVFCYEPRLGPAVGACRMCLVEVEGLPKLQAGCTLTAQDGMVVRTAATSKRAAEGQHGTLEFILVNHPLDCPVCDKGGECPLQDLTFRYGPGSTRMTFAKMTFDKPIPVSPLIALDRERCILCYRCTRFSSDVAEDDQLIARNRGAYSEIATFDEDPYRAPFSGNVIELCPVGALTSTQYRFEARPWEIQDVPTVCGLCPVGCNIRRDDARRRGQARPVAQPPRDRRRLALRQGPLHVPAPPRRGPRSRAAPARAARARAGRLGCRARPRRGAAPRRAGNDRDGALRLGDATRCLRLGVLLRAVSARTPPCSPSRPPTRSTPSGCRSRRSPTAELVVIVGDDDVVDRAPVVDLWLKARARNGAEIVHYGPTRIGAGAGRRRGRRAARAHRARERRSASGSATSERAVLVWSGRGGGGGARLAEAAHALGFDGQARVRRVPPARDPERRAASRRRGPPPRTSDEANPEPIGLLVVSGDEAAADRRTSARSPSGPRTVIAITMFHGARGRLGRPRAPRDRLARARRHAR